MARRFRCPRAIWSGTPNWSCTTTQRHRRAMIWLDGLGITRWCDVDAGFYEEYHQERQDVAAPVNASECIPDVRRCGPPAASRATARRGNHPELTPNPASGGPVWPTIAAISAAAAPVRDRGAGRVCCTKLSVVEGAGYSVVGRAARLGRLRTCHGAEWTFMRLTTATHPAFLFRFSDAP